MCARMSKLAKALKFVLSTASMARYHFVDMKTVRYQKKSELHQGKCDQFKTISLKNVRDASNVFKGIQGHYNKNSSIQGVSRP